MPLRLRAKGGLSAGGGRGHLAAAEGRCAPQSTPSLKQATSALATNDRISADASSVMYRHYRDRQRERRTQREDRERETYRERQRYRDRDLLLMNSHCYFLLKSSSGEFSAFSPSLPSLSQSSSSYTFRDFDAQRQMSQLKYTTRICLCVSACLSVHASLCLHQSLSCKDY